ncbi:MAG: DUF6529 family protein [Acidimicrobiia bacterium]|nr:DUF6529 family protein [Acidimicrobiia bacterium]
MALADRTTSFDRRLIVIVAAGSAVALALGVYGNVHDPTGRSLVTLFFTGTINIKVWLATGAIALAVFQVASALRIYGRIGSGEAPAWLEDAHRIAGTGAFVLSLPVAYHCLWALGFTADAGVRVLVHSIAGCFFYGAFVAKVASVRTEGLPSWTLPVVGGTVFSALVVVWLTSSFWFFTTVEFPGF